METRDEVVRLQRVYAQYHASGRTQRWTTANPGQRAILRERAEVLRQMLKFARILPLTGRPILEIGCGSGNVLASLTEWGASPIDLHGVDLLAERIEEARQRFPGFDFAQGNAEQLHFADGSFDLVILFTVFSSILDHRMAQNVAAEVDRVLRPGGAIIWYDFRFNNPWNPHVRGISRTAIQSYWPEFAVELRRVTLVAPLARRLGRVVPWLYPTLTRIPFLRTHYVGLLTKRSTAHA
jgi:ubiquinone/menaquinone biosynthesis C-methylase UbiE